MTRARDIADLVDANGDIVVSALANVPPSNDASALTTGTLPDGRFPATLPAVSGANLTGIITDVVGDTTPELGGTLTATGYNILFGDSTGGGNNRIKLGNGNDLEIYHNGGNSVVADTGTGDLYLAGDNLRLTNAALSKAYARGYTGGKFSLMYDNAEKLATTLTGVSVTGTVAATSFTGDGSGLTGIQSATLSSSNPLITSNGALGDQWNNYTTGEVFICIDATTNNNIWEGTKGTTVAPEFLLYDFGTTASGTTWTWTYTSSASSHNVAFNSDHIRIDCNGSASTSIGINTRLTTVQAFTIPSGFNTMEVTLYTDADNDTILTRLGTSQYSGNLATFYHNTVAGLQQVFTVDVTAHSGSSVYWGAEANGGQYANVQFRVQKVKFY
jgi:hypothetical protein